MQPSLSTQSMSSGTPKFLRSGPGILLAIAWLYMVAWGVWIAIPAFQPNAGGWEFEEWVVTGAWLVPIILIPLYLTGCVRRKQPLRLKPWLPWVVRIMYVSIILAICDSWIAGTDRRAPLFSHTTWGMSDGGTRVSVGFGYSLTYHRTMGGEHGPEVWFWFSPFTVRYTSQHIGLRWVWQG